MGYPPTIQPRIDSNAVPSPASVGPSFIAALAIPTSLFISPVARSNRYSILALSG
jgi:hypothetical protein